MTVPRICNNTYYRPLFPVVDVSVIEKFSGIASIEYIVKLVDSIFNIYYYVVHIVKYKKKSTIKYVVYEMLPLSDNL